MTSHTLTYSNSADDLEVFDARFNKKFHVQMILAKTPEKKVDLINPGGHAEAKNS